jgi:hypothetical protein
MASTYFTFPALLVIYVAQRAVDLRSALGQPRFAVLPKAKHLRAATAEAA